MISAFSDELEKLAGKEAIIKALKKARSSRMAGPVARAAALGASVSTIQEMLGSDDPRVVRSALAGAAGGAVTGSMFPGWFTKGNTRKHHLINTRGK